MQHLPEEEERDWIVDALADLVRKVGFSPFVSAPIIDSTRRFHLEPYTPDEVDDRHSLAYFAGIEKGTATFGINVEQVADLEPIAGVMAHEVAHAFRWHRGLAVDDHEEEKLLTDLTTIYLGLGVLTANAAGALSMG